MSSMHINTKQTTTTNVTDTVGLPSVQWTYGFSGVSYMSVMPRDAQLGGGPEQGSLQLYSEIVDNGAKTAIIREMGTKKIVRIRGDWLGLDDSDVQTGDAIWVFKRGTSEGDPLMWWAHTSSGSGWLCINKDGYLNVKGEGEYALLAGFAAPAFVG